MRGAWLLKKTGWAFLCRALIVFLLLCLGAWTLGTVVGVLL